MQPGPEGKAPLKLALLRRIGSSALDPARVFLLVNVVESFLPLGPEEESMLWHQLHQEGVLEMEATEISWWELSWADRMMLRGQRDIVRRQMRLRFGTLPPALDQRIDEADGDLLARLAERVITASSIDDLLGPEYPSVGDEGSLGE